MKLSRVLFGPKEMFSPRVLAKKYELIPLICLVGIPCSMAAGYSFYSLYFKSDVRILKSDTPPWEKVVPTTPQKLYTADKENYKPIPELEKLKKEIGSYKT